MAILLSKISAGHWKTLVCGRTGWMLIGFALSTSLSGCVAPFSDLQSARLAGPNRLEVTPSYSAVSVSSERETEELWNSFGIQAAVGISNQVDLRLRYERINLPDSDESGVNVLGFGPKFGVIADKIAVFVPIGFAFGGGIETSETVQVHPTLLLTFPLHENVELNASAKALIPVTERDIDDLAAFNIGIGVGPDLRRWVVRPEIGFLFNPGEEGRLRHLSIGLTYFFDR